jgi:hypothetical protein
MMNRRAHIRWLLLLALLGPVQLRGEETPPPAAPADAPGKTDATPAVTFKFEELDAAGQAYRVDGSSDNYRSQVDPDHFFLRSLRFSWANTKETKRPFDAIVFDIQSEGQEGIRAARLSIERSGLYQVEMSHGERRNFFRTPDYLNGEHWQDQNGKESRIALAVTPKSWFGLKLSGTDRRYGGDEGTTGYYSLQSWPLSGPTESHSREWSGDLFFRFGRRALFKLGHRQETFDGREQLALADGSTSSDSGTIERLESDRPFDGSAAASHAALILPARRFRLELTYARARTTTAASESASLASLNPAGTRQEVLESGRASGEAQTQRIQFLGSFQLSRSADLSIQFLDLSVDTEGHSAVEQQITTLGVPLVLEAFGDNEVNERRREGTAVFSLHPGSLQLDFGAGQVERSFDSHLTTEEAIAAEDFSQRGTLLSAAARWRTGPLTLFGRYAREDYDQTYTDSAPLARQDWRLGAKLNAKKGFFAGLTLGGRKDENDGGGPEPLTSFSRQSREATASIGYRKGDTLVRLIQRERQVDRTVSRGSEPPAELSSEYRRSSTRLSGALPFGQRANGLASLEWERRSGDNPWDRKAASLGAGFALPRGSAIYLQAYYDEYTNDLDPRANYKGPRLLFGFSYLAGRTGPPATLPGD